MLSRSSRIRRVATPPRFVLMAEAAGISHHVLEAIRIYLVKRFLSGTEESSMTAVCEGTCTGRCGFGEQIAEGYRSPRLAACPYLVFPRASPDSVLSLLQVASLLMQKELTSALPLVIELVDAVLLKSLAEQGAAAAPHPLPTSPIPAVTAWKQILASSHTPASLYPTCPPPFGTGTRAEECPWASALASVPLSTLLPHDTLRAARRAERQKTTVDVKVGDTHVEAVERRLKDKVAAVKASLDEVVRERGKRAAGRRGESGAQRGCGGGGEADEQADEEGSVEGGKEGATSRCGSSDGSGAPLKRGRSVLENDVAARRRDSRVKVLSAVDVGGVSQAEKAVLKALMEGRVA